MSLPPVGAQLLVYSSKYKFTDDADLILDSVANSGYAGIEGGVNNPESVKAKLDSRGLVCGGIHVGLAVLDDLKPVIHAMKTLQTTEICNSGLRKWGELDLDDYKDAITRLNNAGKQLKAEGFNLHYHNHAFEFDKIDGGKRGLDLLIEGLDPTSADFCIDVAWVLKGGDDPASFLVKHKDKIGYLHFKDCTPDEWTELGNGVVDFHSIMKVLPELHKVKWVMVEQDKTDKDPVESVDISRRYLKETFGY